MNIAVEISMYPLKEEYVPSILDFIGRLNRYQGIQVSTNDMSTQVLGDYDLVMQILNEEIKETFEEEETVVMVMKILNKKGSLT